MAKDNNDKQSKLVYYYIVKPLPQIRLCYYYNNYIYIHNNYIYSQIITSILLLSDDHEDFLDYDMVEFEDSDLHDILAIHKLNDTTLDKLNFTVCIKLLLYYYIL